MMTGWNREGALLTAPDPLETLQDIDWADLFGNTNPVEIEIGFGKGKFLINAAESNPEVNYLGFDYSLMCARLARKRIEKRGLKNILVCQRDVKPFLHLAFPDNSIAAFHILFPDPWHKKRHNKRRFFKPGTVGQLVRSLIPGGYVQVATDHAEYFVQMDEVLSCARGLVKEDLSANAIVEGRTNYEIKYLREGRTINRALFRHTENPS